MKLLKKSILLSLVAPLLFSLLSFNNVVLGGDAILIRVYEIGYNNRITITTKDEIKVIKLEQSFKSEANLDKNWQTVLNTLNQYLKEGYKIETSTATVHSVNNQQVTTYILTK